MPDFLDASLETKLVAETMVSAELLKLSLNLVIQLVLMDGGNFTTARAVFAHADNAFEAPDLPPVLPVPHGAIEPDAAQGIAATKLLDGRRFILEEAIKTLARRGIAVTP